MLASLTSICYIFVWENMRNYNMHTHSVPRIGPRYIYYIFFTSVGRKAGWQHIQRLSIIYMCLSSINTSKSIRFNKNVSENFNAKSSFHHTINCLTLTRIHLVRSQWWWWWANGEHMCTKYFLGENHLVKFPTNVCWFILTTQNTRIVQRRMVCASICVFLGRMKGSGGRDNMPCYWMFENWF